MHHSLQIMFILPLMTGHLFWKATIKGGLYRGGALYCQTSNISDTLVDYTRPTLERRKTLGHLRSINCNLIINFANQSQTSQLLKISKNTFFFKLFMKRNCEKWRNQSQVKLIKKIHIDYQEHHIYIYMSSSWHNILTISPRWCKSEFTGLAIIEELSIRRRLRTFLISWGQKTCVKHCNVDL